MDIHVVFLDIYPFLAVQILVISMHERVFYILCPFLMYFPSSPSFIYAYNFWGIFFSSVMILYNFF